MKRMFGKKGVIYSLISCVVLALVVSCGSYTFTPSDAHNSVMLSIRAVSVYQNFSNVKSIITNNKQYFTDVNLEDLDRISKNLEGINRDITNLNLQAYSAEQILIDLMHFDLIYEHVKSNYYEAYNIISPQMHKFPIQDQLTLKNYDMNVKKLEEGIAGIKKRISEQKSGSTVDITLILSDIAIIVGSLAKVLAVM